MGILGPHIATEADARQRRNFRNQLEYDEVGLITKTIHQQK
jgi:hypothetical protein